jgi:hypothetical protein
MTDIEILYNYLIDLFVLGFSFGFLIRVFIKAANLSVSRY